MDHETLKNFIKDNLVIHISETYPLMSEGRYVKVGLRFIDETESFCEDSFYISSD